MIYKWIIDFLNDYFHHISYIYIYIYIYEPIVNTRLPHVIWFEDLDT
jgi:hypothetical protein